jgi:drug/metabolite transporter (DMT)-like permease
MIDLILGVLFFVFILIVFKLFDRFKIDNTVAITVNYFVAGSLGLYFSEQTFSVDEIISANWLPYAGIVGALFISTFILIAQGAQKIGMAITTVANKMSLIIPLIVAFLLLGDQISWLKITGIVIAIISIFLTTTQGQKLNFNKRYLPLILIIFIGQGVADSFFNYAQFHHVSDVESKLFICVIFYAAGVGGLLLVLYRLFFTSFKPKARDLLGGIFLGIPNYLTLLYFFKSLENGFLESSQVYPIFNMGIISISALIGFLLFKEKLTTRNWLGIGLAALAIAAIGLG